MCRHHQSGHFTIYCISRPWGRVSPLPAFISNLTHYRYLSLINQLASLSSGQPEKGPIRPEENGQPLSLSGPARDGRVGQVVVVGEGGSGGHSSSPFNAVRPSGSPRAGPKVQPHQRALTHTTGKTCCCCCFSCERDVVGAADRCVIVVVLRKYPRNRRRQHHVIGVFLHISQCVKAC